jgi:hypothetical protein
VETLRGLLWGEIVETVKTVPTSVEACMPMTSQSKDSAIRVLSWLLLEPRHHLAQDREGPVEGSCEEINEPSDYTKCCKILIIAPKRLSSTELVNNRWRRLRYIKLRISMCGLVVS